MPKIEIYTQKNCPFCVRAIALLLQKGVAYNEVDAPRGTAARQEAIERSGGATTVPQIFINGRAVGGCSELLMLEQEGALDRLLRQDT